MPPAPIPGKVQWLPQGWSRDESERWHHESQGTVTVPVEASWLLALERPRYLKSDPGMLSDPEYLQRFGFIPSPRGAWNLDGLPIGFARTSGTSPTNGKAFDRFGFTCAACHTGRIDHDGTTILVDGGPAMVNLVGFGVQLYASAVQTYYNQPRFDRFARRVLGEHYSPETVKQLGGQLLAFLREGVGDLFKAPIFGNVKEGFGRLDALNRIGNLVFGGDMNINANRARTTAPVAYPHLWDTSWFAWVQYNGSIEQPMVRNAGEAMGVAALVNFEDTPTPQYTSTIPVGVLHERIETLIAGKTPASEAAGFTGLRAPKWPENILGTIQPALKARGEEIYRARCQGCHLPATNTPEFWRAPQWSAPNAAGERYLDLKMIPISVVGTDPAQAEDMKNRTVLVPAKYSFPNPVGSSGAMTRHAFGPALGHAVEKVVTRWYDAQLPPTATADRDRMNGYRPNGIRAELSYKSRPLDGIWATPPYLHNGSVPTLFELLSPYAIRQKRSCFYLGSTEFDVKWVGYKSIGAFKLCTNTRGNRNKGHLFDTSLPAGTGKLGDDIPEFDRYALIEYLKSL